LPNDGDNGIANQQGKGMAGFGDLDMMQRGRRLAVGVVMLGLGGILGYAWPESTATPSSEKGAVIAVGNATADAGLRFTFRPADARAKKAPDQNFLLQDATPWQAGPSRPWRYQGFPPCLIPGSTASTPVTLGVVSVRGIGALANRSVVAWVECYS
jgi:hypothetical protein